MRDEQSFFYQAVEVENLDRCIRICMKMAQRKQESSQLRLLPVLKSLVLYISVLQDRPHGGGGDA